MNEIIFLVEEDIEGGYIAKALGESIITQGDTLEELKKNVKDAVNCHFEDDKKPKLIRLHIVKEEVLPNV
ncbi:type II toxin-antitoxin system HicB family antitoxin [Persephonella sp.]|nr:2-oxoisovalerate dehydrogenase [Persephonella sp.]